MSFLCEMKRYGVIDDFKEQLEVVLLRGGGCSWGRCTFCDYCKDYTSSMHDNYKLNRKVLSQVTGKFGKLQVICSGSFAELDLMTIRKIKEICLDMKIHTIIFEGHWMHRYLVDDMKKMFDEFNLEFIVGAETFNIQYREHLMKKGMGYVTPSTIRKYFNRVNIMFGLEHQTLQMLEEDMRIACELFDKVALNIFTPNTTQCKRNEEAVQEFYNSRLYHEVMKNPKVRVLDDLNRDKTDTFDLVGESLDKIVGGGK